MKSICSGWEFTSDPSESFFKGEVRGGADSYAIVRLPHSVSETPLHYAAPEDYTGVFGYRRTIEITDKSKRYFVRFDGAAHAAKLFVNGVEVGSHFCGYTAFRTEITDFVHEGSNLIAVELDTTERPDVPPFGLVMDYLGYGGLCREAWLEEENPTYIEDIFVYADHEGQLCGELTVSGRFSFALCRVKEADEVIREFTVTEPRFSEKILGIAPW